MNQLPSQPSMRGTYKTRTDNKGRGRPNIGLHWNAREFISWDGEGIQHEPSFIPPANMHWWCESILKKDGKDRLDEIGIKTFGRTFDMDMPRPQPYVLLANSKEERITAREGLTTLECLEFILNTKQRYRDSIFVAFGFNYDIAQILCDLPQEGLERLYDKGQYRWGAYRIYWRPRRWLRVSHRLSNRTATIYDTIGFFQSTFLSACQKYLGTGDPDYATISDGKESRDTFLWSELEDKIIPYNDAELRMHVKVMNQLREDFHNIGLDLAQWYGPGAVANKLLKQYNVHKHMSKEIPQEVTHAAMYAYAGGRFEHLQIGRHQGNVYEYDIRSAYPKGATLLPSLQSGTWEYTETYEPQTFGVWNIDYIDDYDDDRPRPLFCRSQDGRISFPPLTKGWYWGPEADLVSEHVRSGWVWRGTDDYRPFAFNQELFNLRRGYKQSGNPSERAIKLCLNSEYGKLAQTIGGKNGPPKLHQLEWAGWITSYVRSLIYKAILLSPQSIIAIETDAVFSTEPLDLPLGEDLGQWELTTFDEITYLQSGFYYALQGEKIICRYRGMDRDRATGQPVGLPYRGVLDHLRNRRKPAYGRTPALSSSTTRFINIGLSLRTNSVFRSWETSPKEISVDQSARKSKRYHLGGPNAPSCYACDEGLSLADCLHPMGIGGHYGDSHPHALPWVEVPQEYRFFLEQEEMDKWQ